MHIQGINFHENSEICSPTAYIVYILTMLKPKLLRVDNASCGLPNDNARIVSSSHGLLLILTNYNGIDIKFNA